jgi:putative ABC transport system permease protein
MSISTLLKIAVRNIYRHRGKYQLTGVVIFFASILFFLSASLVWQARLSWRDYAATTFLGRCHITALDGQDRDYSLPSMKFPKKSIPAAVTGELDRRGIAWTKRIKLGAAVYNEQEGKFENFLVTLIGADISRELSLLHNLEIIEGRWDPGRQDGVLVWHELAGALKKKPGDELTLYVKDVDDNSYPYTFTIAGLLGQKKPAGLEGKGVMMIFPLVFSEYRFIAEKTGYDNSIMEIALWGAVDGELDALGKTAAGAGLQLFSAEQGFGVLYGMVDIIGFIGMILKAFVLVVLLVAGLNVNMMSYFDRQKELATILAIGAKPRWIVMLLCAELMLFATAVYLAALLAYWLLTLLLCGGFDIGELSTLFAGRLMYISLVPSSIAAGYGIIVCIVALSALYPLYLCTKTNPIEVFREESL